MARQNITLLTFKMVQVGFSCWALGQGMGAEGIQPYQCEELTEFRYVSSFPEQNSHVFRVEIEQAKGAQAKGVRARGGPLCPQAAEGVLISCFARSPTCATAGGIRQHLYIAKSNKLTYPKLFQDFNGLGV